MSVGTVTHSISATNSADPAACTKPIVGDGDAMLMVVTVPTLVNTNSVVTPPADTIPWVLLGHYHDTTSSGIGLTVALFIKGVPSAAAETPTTYAVTATNKGAAKTIVQILPLSGRDAAVLSSSPISSVAVGTSSATIAAGTVNPGTSGDGDLWDVIYIATSRSNVTFTSPTAPPDVELDDYKVDNTSSAIYLSADQPSGTFTKSATSTSGSGTGLGVMIAIKNFVAPAPASPIKRWDGTGYVDLDCYRWNGTVYVPVDRADL